MAVEDKTEKWTERDWDDFYDWMAGYKKSPFSKPFTPKSYSQVSSPMSHLPLKKGKRGTNHKSGGGVKWR